MTKQICVQCNEEYEYFDDDTPAKYVMCCSDGCVEAHEKGELSYKEKVEYIMADMESCDDCMRIKAEGGVPGCCQYHIDQQMKLKR